MRILTRYILREVTAHALIGAAIFTFVLFTRDLGRDVYKRQLQMTRLGFELRSMMPG